MSVSGMNTLGSGLLSVVHQPPKTFSAADGAQGTFCSPISVSLAMVLLLNGATPGSKVEQELLLLLQKGSGNGSAADATGGAASVNRQYEQLLGQLMSASGAGAGADKAGGGAGAGKDGSGGAASDGKGGKNMLSGVVLTMATSLWARPPLRFLGHYERQLAAHLRSTVHELRGAGPINEWCSKETGGKITDLVDEGSASQAVAILASAVYFKGAWERAFDAGSTQGLPFRLGGPPGGTGSDQSVIDAAMMYRKFERGQAGYVREEGGFEGVRLPYKGGDFAAIALLPAEGGVEAGTGPAAASGDVGSGVSALMQRLAAHEFVEKLGWGKPEVHVWLPRFKLETDLKLKPALQQLGVAAAFQPSGDFGEMVDRPENIFVEEVLHKVFIEVNEEGTEAAAATAVLMMRSCMPIRTPIEVRFDRPFVFGVQHVPTGAMLFLGVVDKPETWLSGGISTSGACGAAAEEDGGPPAGYPSAQ